MDKQSSRQLAARWARAREDLKKAKSRVNGAQCELTNATNALGRHIDPGDQQLGEKICLWVRFGIGENEERCVESEMVNVSGNGTFRLEIRGKPREVEKI